MIGLAPHAWSGGLLGDDEIAVMFAPEAELGRLLKVEAAWTRALAETEGFDSDRAARLAADITTAPIDPADLREGFSRDGVPIPTLVSLLKAHAGTEAEHWIHRGLTSQDVMDTSLMLTLVDVLGVLQRRVIAMQQVLESLRDGHGQRVCIAYTRMQAALETSVGELLDRWQAPLGETLATLGQLGEYVAVIQWGGPIGLRQHEQPERLGFAFANQLALKDPGRAWHTDRRSIADVAQQLLAVTVATGKIGEDISLMAALGPEHISLAGGGSSAMPHKNNPIKAEALISLSDYAANSHAALVRSGRHEGFRSGQAWMLEALTLPPLCVAAGASVRVATELLGSVRSLGRAR